MQNNLNQIRLNIRLRRKEIKENAFFLDNKYDTYKKYNEYEYFKDICTENQFNAILRQDRNRYGKRYRANKKLEVMSNCMRRKANNEYLHDIKVVFGTCTFKDSMFFKGDTRSPIKERTRTKKVNEWLKHHFLYSVANIDYGEKNEREHHHFIGILKDTELIPVLDKNGNQIKSKKGFPLWNIKNDNYNLGWKPDIEIIEYNSKDLKLKKVSNYLLKVNNHINKDSTKNRRFRVLKGYEIQQQEDEEIIQKASSILNNKKIIIE